MTTLAAQRTALASAVAAADDYVDPPGCMVFSSGSNLDNMTGKRQALWTWRVTCYVGYKSDSAASSADLAELVDDKLAILLALPGFSVNSVGPDSVRQIAGGDHLTADIAVSAFVTL